VKIFQLEGLRAKPASTQIGLFFNSNSKNSKNVTTTAINTVEKSQLVTWFQRLTANAKVETVLGSIPASSDTVESEGRQMKQC
jgi:hypothetical protein